MNQEPGSGSLCNLSWGRGELSAWGRGIPHEGSETETIVCLCKQRVLDPSSHLPSRKPGPHTTLHPPPQRHPQHHRPHLKPRPRDSHGSDSTKGWEGVQSAGHLKIHHCLVFLSLKKETIQTAGALRNDEACCQFYQHPCTLQDLPPEPKQGAGGRENPEA